MLAETALSNTSCNLTPQSLPSLTSCYIPRVSAPAYSSEDGSRDTEQNISGQKSPDRGADIDGVATSVDVQTCAGHNPGLPSDIASVGDGGSGQSNVARAQSSPTSLEPKGLSICKAVERRNSVADGIVNNFSISHTSPVQKRPHPGETTLPSKRHKLCALVPAVSANLAHNGPNSARLGKQSRETPDSTTINLELAMFLDPQNYDFPPDESGVFLDNSIDLEPAMFLDSQNYDFVTDDTGTFLDNNVINLEPSMFLDPQNYDYTSESGSFLVNNSINLEPAMFLDPHKIAATACGAGEFHMDAEFEAEPDFAPFANTNDDGTQTAKNANTSAATGNAMTLTSCSYSTTWPGVWPAANYQTQHTTLREACSGG